MVLSLKTVQFIKIYYLFFSPENKAFGKMLDMDFTTEKGSWKVMQGAEVDGRKASEQAHKVGDT